MYPYNPLTDWDHIHRFESTQHDRANLSHIRQSDEQGTFITIERATTPNKGGFEVILTLGETHEANPRIYRLTDQDADFLIDNLRRLSRPSKPPTNTTPGVHHQKNTP